MCFTAQLRRKNRRGRLRFPPVKGGFTLQHLFRLPAVAVVVAVLVTSAIVAMGSTATAAGGPKQYIVEVGNSANYNGVRARAAALGATVVRDIPQIRRVVVSATDAQTNALASDSRVASVGLDGVRTLGPPE